MQGLTWVPTFPERGTSHHSAQANAPRLGRRGAYGWDNQSVLINRRAQKPKGVCVSEIGVDRSPNSSSATPRPPGPATLGR